MTTRYNTVVGNLLLFILGNNHLRSDGFWKDNSNSSISLWSRVYFQWPLYWDHGAEARCCNEYVRKSWKRIEWPWMLVISGNLRFVYPILVFRSVSRETELERLEFCSWPTVSSSKSFKLTSSWVVFPWLSLMKPMNDRCTAMSWLASCLESAFSVQNKEFPWNWS